MSVRPLLSPSLFDPFAVARPLGVLGLRRFSTGAPHNTVLPVIDNQSPKDGDTLTVSDGTWSGSPTSFTYAWFRDGSLASTGNTYGVTVSDIGHSLTAKVTATNAIGSTTVETTAVFPVEAVPVNTVAPAASWDDLSTTFTVDNGTWNFNPTSYAYDWCEDFVSQGVTTSTWNRGAPPNPGVSVICKVTATNSAGSTEQDSNTISF